MPRGQRSKHRAREKRREACIETKDLGDAQATACATPTSGSTPPGSPAASAGQKPQGAAATSSPVAGASCPRSKARARRQVKKCKSSSQASISAKIPCPDPLTRKAGVLMHFMLERFVMKQPIRKIDMVKLVPRMFKAHFPEIFQKASEHIELVFGLELKEVKPNGSSYTLVTKVGLANDGVLGSSLEVPKNGLLMPLLGVIFLKGNCASEAEIWDFLNIMGLYDGKTHIIFGEPRKFITEELVQEKYLLYRQIPDSDPLSYEFLWGPRAHAETSKMKVLEFVAKLNGTVPSAFLFHYEEALRDEEERAKARPADRACAAAKATAHSKILSSPQ